MAFVEFWLRIEKIHLAGAAVLEKADHRVGGWLMMGPLYRVACHCRGAALQQMRQGKRTQGAGRLVQKGPTRGATRAIKIHGLNSLGYFMYKKELLDKIA